jgi:hypothetical protein
MMDFSPLPWGEGGESSEPGEGFLPTEPRNFGIRFHASRVVRDRRIPPRYSIASRISSSVTIAKVVA